MEAILTELNYFESSITQLSVNGEYDRVYGPIQTMVPGSPIEFFVHGADGLYLDLYNSKLEIRVKITQADGVDLPNNANVGPVNDLLNTMFKSVEMELGGVVITDPTTRYAYRAVIENLINYNRLVSQTRLLAEGWKKDTAGHMNVTDITGNNLGLRSRAACFARSRGVTLIGRPHLDLFHQEKLIPSNIDLKLRFIPHKNSFLLKTPAPGDQPQHNFRIILSNARLFVRTKEVSTNLIMAQEKLLQTRNYSIPYDRILSKILTIPTGTTQMEFDSVYQGKLPDLIMLGMISDTNMSGGYQQNPFNFQHFGLTYLAMQANGETIPRLAYQPNFENGDYIRSYFGVLEALGFDVGPTCWDITPDEWEQGYNLYAFKVTPGPIGMVKTPSRVGSIRIELKFDAPTTFNINILLLSQQGAELQIDKYKNVLTVN